MRCRQSLESSLDSITLAIFRRAFLMQISFLPEPLPVLCNKLNRFYKFPKRLFLWRQPIHLNYRWIHLTNINLMHITNKSLEKNLCPSSFKSSRVCRHWNCPSLPDIFPEQKMVNDICSSYPISILNP